MELIDKINALALRCKSHGKNLKNEEQTKMTLILPFIQMLGYDVFDPSEVVPEYDASLGVKKEDRVDYALMKDGKPIILIECKAYGTQLDAQKCSQLMRYFAGTPAHVGVLTDGNRYQLYSDLKEPNKMDDRPYIEFTLEDFKEIALPAIKKLTKDEFDVDVLQNEAKTLMYSKRIKDILTAEFKKPSLELVSWFVHKVDRELRNTRSVQDRFAPILDATMKSWLKDEINSRLESAKQPEQADQPDQLSPQDYGIVTTEMEIQVYLAVKAILAAVMPPEKVTLNDCKGFCNILYDGKQTKRIARMYSDGEQVTWFCTTDENNNEANGKKISGLDDIYQFTDELRETAKRYL